MPIPNKEPPGIGVVELPARSPDGVQVRFEFDIGDRVTIRGSSIEADVIGLLKGHTGVMYEICWWYSGMRYTTWVYAREIAKGSTSEATR